MYVYCVAVHLYYRFSHETSRRQDRKRRTAEDNVRISFSYHYMITHTHLSSFFFLLCVCVCVCVCVISPQEVAEILGEDGSTYQDSNIFLKGTQSANPHNDYSQHFVDTGQRPQNFIRDVGGSCTVFRLVTNIPRGRTINYVEPTQLLEVILFKGCSCTCVRGSYKWSVLLHNIMPL